MIVTRDKNAALKKLVPLAIEYGLIDVEQQFSTLESFLKRIPILTKTDLFKRVEDQQEMFLSRGILFSETSGSTGEPLVTPRNAEDLGWNTNNQMLAYKKYLTAGVDRVAIIHPGILSPFVEASCLALNQLGVGFVRVFALPKICEYTKIYEVLKRYKITTIMTTPTLASKVFYEFNKHALPNNLLSIDKLLLTGEPITPHSADNFSEILNCSAKTIPFVYGSSETATVMIGNTDCSYDPISEDFIFELVDPETNEHLDSGVNGAIEGKLVISWLRNGLLPILRYDTGDIFRVTSDESRVAWECLGRTQSNGVSARVMDEIIYQEKIPIYHYECNVINDHIYFTIITIPGGEENIDVDLIKTLLHQKFSDKYSCSIEINPEIHEFYEFSIKPKMSRISLSN